MDETRILALRALCELLDDDGRDERDDLVACYRALRKAIAKNKPMKRKDRARVAEHLRKLGWTEFAIDAATTHTGARAGQERDRHNATEARVNWQFLT
jgi:hypothetical protein